MSAADRAPLGKAGLTNAEIDARLVAKSEKQLQEQIAGLLRIRGIYFVRSRMDRKTTTPLGTPDFILCLKGRFVAWEVKVGANHPSPEQTTTLRSIEENGGQIEVIRNLERVKEILGCG